MPLPGLTLPLDSTDAARAGIAHSPQESEQHNTHDPEAPRDARPLDLGPPSPKFGALGHEVVSQCVASGQAGMMPSLVSGGNPGTLLAARIGAQGQQRRGATSYAACEATYHQAVPKSKETTISSTCSSATLAGKDAHRRVRSALKKADTESGRANRAIRRELKSLRVKSRKELESFLDPRRSEI